MKYIIGRDDVLYDVSSILYATIDSFSIDDPAKKAAILDINAESNIDRFSRVMEKSVRDIEIAMAAYAKKEVATTELENNLSAPTKFEINVEFPIGFYDSAAVAINTSIHEYVVTKILSDWLGGFGIKNDYFLKSINHKAEIKQYCNMRITPIRQKPSLI